MEVELRIEPGHGIGPAALGMTRAEVRAALAPLPGALASHSSHGSIDYFFGNALQVEYSPDGHASFMGASFYPGCGCIFSMDGLNPWALSAQELFAHLAAMDGDAHDYSSTEHVFPRRVVTLWDADCQYDHLGGEQRPVWAQVGIGDSVYLGRVARE
jgi:hypothetical protein